MKVAQKSMSRDCNSLWWCSWGIVVRFFSSLRDLHPIKSHILFLDFAFVCCNAVKQCGWCATKITWGWESDGEGKNSCSKRVYEICMKFWRFPSVWQKHDMQAYQLLSTLNLKIIVALVRFTNKWNKELNFRYYELQNW
jgi:hypothetical protein